MSRNAPILLLLWTLLMVGVPQVRTASAIGTTAAAASVVVPGGPAAASHDSVTSRERTTTQIAPGVFVIRHEDAPDAFPQSNTTVIVGDREVLVVDSGYMPSSAKKDVAQIRAWTQKPVRYLVNTHWHYDHTMGNGVYRDAFPGLAVVAHQETRKQVAGYNPQWFATFPQRADRFKAILEAGKDANGKPLTAGEVAEYKTAIAGIEPVWAEFRSLATRTDLAPNLAFDQSITFDLGGREVRVIHLGRGNTAGDAIVYLPAEKIAITGDLLVHPVPYLGGGYPVDFIATLERLHALEVDLFVPGHGQVLLGKAYLELVTGFLRAIVSAVDLELHRQGNGPRRLEAIKQAVLASVPIDAWRDRFAGNDQEARDFFDGFSLEGVITAAYAQLWPR